MNIHELTAMESHQARLKTKAAGLANQMARFQRLHQELLRIKAEFAQELESDTHIKSHFFYVDLLSNRALQDREEVHQKLKSEIKHIDDLIHENAL